MRVALCCGRSNKNLLSDPEKKRCRNHSFQDCYGLFIFHIAEENLGMSALDSEKLDMSCHLHGLGLAQYTPLTMVYLNRFPTIWGACEKQKICIEFLELASLVGSKQRVHLIHESVACLGIRPLCSRCFVRISAYLQGASHQAAFFLGDYPWLDLIWLVVEPPIPRI